MVPIVYYTTYLTLALIKSPSGHLFSYALIILYLMEAPPPTYEHDEPEAQIEILPASDALSFQSGYLGADDERAAMEGEVHLKGAGGGWEKLSVRYSYPAQRLSLRPVYPKNNSLDCD